MTNRVELVELELSQHRVIPKQPTSLSTDQHPVRALLRWHGTPIGTVDAPTFDRLLSAAFPYYNESLYTELIRNRLTQPFPDTNPNNWRIEQRLKSKPQPVQVDLKITLAYCFSQDSLTLRSDRSALLESLLNQTYPHLQILLIEYDCDRSQPRDLAIQHCLNSGAHVEYYPIAEQDLDDAHQVALHKFSGDLISFVDDRTVLDPNWATSTAQLFDRNAEVRIMTGLTLPINLAAKNQVPYENLYGLACGFSRRWIQVVKVPNWTELGIMQYGSPTNLVIHRTLIQSPQQFSWTWLTQALLQGEILVYEPRSIVRLRLPETNAQIEQVAYEGMRSFYTYICEGIHLHPTLKLQFLTLGLWKLTRVLGAWVKTYGLPRSWFTAELRAIYKTLTSRHIRRFFLKKSVGDSSDRKTSQVFTVELSQPIEPIHAPDADSVRIYIKWLDRLLGHVSITHHGTSIGSDRIADAFIDQFFDQLMAIPFPGNPNAVWQSSERAIAHYFAQQSNPIAPIHKPASLPDTVSVSIIVPTCDRPDDLRQCLSHLHRIKTDRPLEIIVADNRPLKGSAAKILQDFPGVKLVEERRPGSSYARNAAIGASTGEIVVMVDDDVVVPPDWLENLIAPFSRPEVMSVCGGVLPLVLDTPAQLMFEDVKGGLCFGFEKRDVDKAWLDSFEHDVPPIWELGVSANAAFRSTIFSHPTIGLMEETLGPGTSTGGAEENHYAYKILRSGGTIVYDPSSYVWHHHRRTLIAFYNQVQGQMMSCPALHLTLWLKEGDRRGRQQLLINMPRYFWQCWRDRILGRSKTPWIILLYELKGYCMGFSGYWKSQRSVQRQGRSDRYIPVNDR